jgi:hypothetical protein
MVFSGMGGQIFESPTKKLKEAFLKWKLAGESLPQ